MPQVTQQIILEYIAKTDKLQAQIADLNKKTEQFAQNVKDSAKVVTDDIGGKGNTAMATFKDTVHQVGIAIAAAFTVKKISDFIASSIRLARETQEIKLAFEKLNNPNLLSNLRKSVSGTLSDLQLMKIALKADNFNVPLQDLGKLLQFAKLKADATGESFEALATTIVESIGRNSGRALVQLGISQQDINKKVRETGSLYAGLIGIVDEALLNIGDDIDSAADKQDRLNASVANLKVEIGEKLIPVYESFLNLVNKGLGEVQKTITAITDPRQLKLDELNKKLEESNMNLEQQVANLEQLKKDRDAILSFRDRSGTPLDKFINTNDYLLLQETILKIEVLENSIKSLSNSTKNPSLVNYSKLSIEALEELAAAGDELARKEIQNRKKAQEAYQKMFAIAEALIDKYLRDEGQRLIHQYEEELKLIKENTVLSALQKKEISELIKLKIRDAEATTLQVSTYQDLNSETQSLIDKYPALAKALQLSVDTSFQLLKKPPEVGPPQGIGSDEDTEERLDNIFLLANTVQGLFSTLDQYAYASTEYQLSLIEEQNAKGLLSDKAYESAKKKILEKEAERRKKLALFEAALSVPVAILSSIKDGPAAIIAATILSFAKLAEVIAVPTPKFAKGTERVMGGKKGQDSVLSLLMPDEAVIRADENMKRPGMAKAWNEGRLDDYILRVYAPKLMQKIETQQKFDDSNMLRGFNELIITNRETNRILKKLDKNYNPYRNWN